MAESRRHDRNVSYLDRFREAPLYIIDMPNIKLLDLRTMARRLQVEKGVKIIFVDYLTLITHDRRLSRMDEPAISAGPGIGRRRNRKA